MKSNRLLIALAVLLCVSGSFMAVQLISLSKQAHELQEKLNMATEAQMKITEITDVVAILY